VPPAVWFAGWALADIPNGLMHFMRTFVGTGYCGDLSCVGQWVVTTPLVGGVAYALAVRARRRSTEMDGARHS
jgi:hypothetical protein